MATMFVDCPSCGRTQLFIKKDNSAYCYSCKKSFPQSEEFALIREDKMNQAKEESKRLKEEEEMFKRKQVQQPAQVPVPVPTQDDYEEQEQNVQQVNPKQGGVWQVAQVPSDFSMAIVNMQTQEVLDVNAALVKVLNDLDYIKKVIA